MESMPGVGTIPRPVFGGARRGAGWDDEAIAAGVAALCAGVSAAKAQFSAFGADAEGWSVVNVNRSPT
jgi:hypothetical protein